MTEWKTYRLGDIIDKVIDNRGKSAPTSDEKYSPIIEINSIGDRNPNYDVVRKWVSKDTYDTWFRSGHPMIGDILIPTVGTIGIVSMMRENKGCIAQNIVALRTNEKAHNLYLYYFLKSGYVKQELLNLNIGGVQPSIKVPHLLNFEISLPSLEEQRRIAGILGAIDDKIENNRHINTNLELQAQALYKQWFVDFDFPNEDGKPYKSSGGKMVDSELGPIPEGWRVGNIGGYCKIRSGYAFKSSWWTDRGVKIIKIKNITENGALDMSECSYVDIKHCDKASDFNGHAGDLIIAMTGATLGKVCIIPYHTTDYYINQRVGKFFLGDNPINKLPFIHCILRDENVMSEIINKGQGSAQPNISASDVETIKIVMPSYYIMDKFNLLLQSNYTLRLKNIALINKLATLRDTLLPKLMNGEIKL